MKVQKSNEYVLKRDLRHISGIFGRKKVFLKNRTWPCFGHCCYAFLNKKSVKTDDEISNKRQKTSFSGIFGRKSTLIENPALYLGIGILHQCGKFHEKI